jgi:hypothetical protein
MEWISFFGPRRPINGQKIIYYGEMLGVWRGTYRYLPDDSWSPHMIDCRESAGACDRMDAPWWMPDEGQDKPEPPAQAYPDDYPNGKD